MKQFFPYRRRPAAEQAARSPAPDGGELSGPAKKPRRWLGWGLAAAAAAILLAGGLYWALGPSDGQPSARQMRRVIWTSDDVQLTNTDFSYYFWSEYFYFVSQNAPDGVFQPADEALFPLDTAKPLDQQTYDGKISWQFYMKDQALRTIANTQALCRAAEQEGFVLDREFTDSMEAVLESFAAAARDQGFTDKEGNADLNAYLQDSYGPGAQLESFRRYLYDSYLSAAYSDHLYQAPVFTDEELSAYYDSQNYEKDLGVKKVDSPVRTARVIAIRPEGDDQADWDKAYEQCRSILTTWNSQGGREDDFAKLAVTYSADSATGPVGGLLEDVYPGKFSGKLDHWLFDENRQAGDAAILKLEDRYEIVYLSHISDEIYWKTVAEEDLRFETGQNAVLELVESYQRQVDWEHIVIAAPKNLYTAP